MLNLIKKKKKKTIIEQNPRWAPHCGGRFEQTAPTEGGVNALDPTSLQLMYSLWYWIVATHLCASLTHL